MFETVKKVRVSEQIANSIRDTILGGSLAVGDRLPSERDLAQQFGVNRASVREAIKILEQYKLIHVHHGGGAEVVDFWSEGGLDLMPWLLSAKGGLDTELLGNLMEARALFCREMARLASHRSSAELLEELTAVHRQLLEGEHDADAIQRFDFEFFYQLSLGCGNRVFIFLMNMIRSVYGQRDGLFSALYDDIESVINAQAEIIEAIAAGDPERAVQATDGLMLFSADELKRRFGG